MYEAWWIAWIICILTGFAIPEFLAIKNHQEGDTLSENIRLWLRTDTPGGGKNWIAIWSFMAFILTWLLGHILHWWA